MSGPMQDSTYLAVPVQASELTAQLNGDGRSEVFGPLSRTARLEVYTLLFAVAVQC
jgi:hypothetical protein